MVQTSKYDLTTINNIREVLNTNGLELAYIPNQIDIMGDYHEALCEAALWQNPMALAYVKNPTINLCLVALVKNGMAIKYINKPRVMFVNVALNQTGLAIKHISKDPTYLRDIGCTEEELVFKAVAQNGLALKYSNIQTPEICEMAVKSNPKAYALVEQQYKNKYLHELSLN